MLQEDAVGAQRVPTGMPAWLPTISPISAEWLEDAAEARSTSVRVQSSGGRDGGDACAAAGDQGHGDCPQQDPDDSLTAVSGLGEAAACAAKDKRAADSASGPTEGHRAYHPASPDTSSNCHSLDSTLVAKTGNSGRNVASPLLAAVHTAVQQQHARHVGDVGGGDCRQSKHVSGDTSADASPILQRGPAKVEPVCDVTKDARVDGVGPCAERASEQEGLLSICDILTFGVEPEASGPVSADHSAHGMQRVTSAYNYNDEDICELLTFGDSISHSNGHRHNVTVLAGHVF